MGFFVQNLSFLPRFQAFLACFYTVFEVLWRVVSSAECFSFALSPFSFFILNQIHKNGDVILPVFTGVHGVHRVHAVT